MRTIWTLGATAILGMWLSACGDKKAPLVPDNTADPLMLDAGGPVPVADPDSDAAVGPPTSAATQ